MPYIGSCQTPYGLVFMPFTSIHLVPISNKVFTAFYIFKVLHAAVGLVRSDAALTGMQIASRIIMIWMVCNPVENSRTNIGEYRFRETRQVFLIILNS